MAFMGTELALWLNEQVSVRGWTLRQVARKSGLSHTTVVDIANGQRANPEIGTVTRLAKAFGADPVELCRVAGILPQRRLIGEGRADYDLGEDDDVRLIRLYRELPEDEKGFVMELVERLSGRRAARIVGREED
jgi:transcriptional regulator with XRE-family HTH domain